MVNYSSRDEQKSSIIYLIVESKIKGIMGKAKGLPHIPSKVLCGLDVSINTEKL